MKDQFGRWWRMLTVIGIVGAFIVTPTAAQAAIEGDCTGSATIDGVTYGPNNDTPANPIVVPIDRDGVIADWSASVGFENKNHHGELGIVIGPWTIRIAKWEGSNEQDKRGNSGQYNLDDLKEQIPVPANLIPRGIYEVSGSHEASGGSCQGRVMVELAGDLFSSPLGIATVAGTVVTGLTLLGSAFRR